MVKLQPSKLAMGVRFSSPALAHRQAGALSRGSSVVEHLHGKEGVTSSILVLGSQSLLNHTAKYLKVKNQEERHE